MVFLRGDNQRRGYNVRKKLGVNFKYEILRRALKTQRVVIYDLESRLKVLEESFLAQQEQIFHLSRTFERTNSADTIIQNGNIYF